MDALFNSPYADPHAYLDAFHIRKIEYYNAVIINKTSRSRRSRAAVTDPRMVPPAGRVEEEDVRAEWLTTLADEPHQGAVRDEMGVLAHQALASVYEALRQPGTADTGFERVPVSYRV